MKNNTSPADSAKVALATTAGRLRIINKVLLTLALILTISINNPTHLRAMESESTDVYENSLREWGTLKQHIEETLTKCVFCIYSSQDNVETKRSEQLQAIEELNSYIKRTIEILNTIKNSQYFDQEKTATLENKIRSFVVSQLFDRKIEGFRTPLSNIILFDDESLYCKTDIHPSSMITLLKISELLRIFYPDDVDYNAIIWTLLFKVINKDFMPSA